MGAIANQFGGDIAQRGVDAITAAWAEEEGNRIGEKATEDRKANHEERNLQLRAIADHWYAENTEWAEEEKDFSGPGRLHPDQGRGGSRERQGQRGRGREVVKRVHRAAAAVLALLFVGTAAGCATEEKRDYSLPENLCGVPVDKELVDPLFPPGKTVEQQAEPLEPPVSSCRVLVDKRRVLFVSISQIGEFSDPMGEREKQPFRNRKEMKDLPFDGEGAVGDTNAMIAAECTSDASRYVIVEFTVGESLDEDTDRRREKIDRFAKGYTKAVQKAVSCSA
ncbi:hypothetical protein ABZ778_03050 [Streptomyces bacillaris]|uniref:hypothetical protein n=1 Tax=Streptomyces bacillaris TaxID=68179 RepID=UPI0034600829